MAPRPGARSLLKPAPVSGQLAQCYLPQHLQCLDPSNGSHPLQQWAARMYCESLSHQQRPLPHAMDHLD
ncbi:hypothetical protein PHLCEN_2v12948 [Hermanssonia centrifuga]|uniref:Uncharacterized protein n=1 Tax=Hermanssonia centrifuga TaxID=98765 RepID=A0A2R6NFK8_9APHY|nr:hypothetical protein PHLCEN_2v12948 [Hermanssonia centrifuga]